MSERTLRRESQSRAAPGSGTRGISQVRQLREQADLGRDRAVDLFFGEVPAMTRGSRAPRGASVDAEELQLGCGLGIPTLTEDHDPGIGRGRGRRLGCWLLRDRGLERGRGRRLMCWLWRDRGLGRARRANGEIAAVLRAARRDEVVAIGGAILDVAESERERAGDVVGVEVPRTPRVGRAPRRASGTRGELAAPSAP